MTQFVLLLLVAFSSILAITAAKQSPTFLTIDFSLDSKADDETGHVVIRYSLTEDGQEFDVRSVFDSAMQASHRRQLPTESVEKIVRLVRELPKADQKGIARDWLVTVRFRDKNKTEVYEYHRKELPGELKEILELMGGIRFELKDAIGFAPKKR